MTMKQFIEDVHKDYKIDSSMPCYMVSEDYFEEIIKEMQSKGADLKENLTHQQISFNKTKGRVIHAVYGHVTDGENHLVKTERKGGKKRAFIFSRDIDTFWKKYLKGKKTPKPKMSLNAMKGIHTIKWTMFGAYFSPIEMGNNEMPFLNNEINDDLINEINSFKEQKDTYAELKLDYKRGILLHGSAGNGKTSFIKAFCKDADAMTVIVDTQDTRSIIALIDFLADEDNDSMLKFIVFEDIDGMDNEDRSLLLNFLDGVSRVHNTIFIATTNFPDKLDIGIRNRPNRFDLFIKIGNPNEESRAKLLKKFFPDIVGEELKQAVKHSEGFSGAYFKEIFIKSKIKKYSPVEAIKEIQKRMYWDKS